MKTAILLATLLWGSAVNQTFATDVKVTPVVLQSFKNTFYTATNVQWFVVDHLYKAIFDVAGEAQSAFFSADDGALVATCRYLAVSELPRTLRHALKTTAASALIIELFDVQGTDGTDYYAVVKQSDKTVVLKATETGWRVFKK